MDAHTLEVPPALDPPQSSLYDVMQRGLCTSLAPDDLSDATGVFCYTWLCWPRALASFTCVQCPAGPMPWPACADLREMGGREEESRARGRSQVSLDPEPSSNSVLQPNSKENPASRITKLTLDPHLAPEPHLTSKEEGWVEFSRKRSGEEDSWTGGDFRGHCSTGTGVQRGPPRGGAGGRLTSEVAPLGEGDPQVAVAPAEAVGEEGGEGGGALPQEWPRPGRHLQWGGRNHGLGGRRGESPPLGHDPPSTSPSLTSDTRTHCLSIHMWAPRFWGPGSLPSFTG